MAIAVDTTTIPGTTIVVSDEGSVTIDYSGYFQDIKLSLESINDSISDIKENNSLIRTALELLVGDDSSLNLPAMSLSQQRIADALDNIDAGLERLSGEDSTQILPIIAVSQQRIADALEFLKSNTYHLEKISQTLATDVARFVANISADILIVTDMFIGTLSNGLEISGEAVEDRTAVVEQITYTNAASVVRNAVANYEAEEVDGVLRAVSKNTLVVDDISGISVGQAVRGKGIIDDEGSVEDAVKIIAIEGNKIVLSKDLISYYQGDMIPPEETDPWVIRNLDFGDTYIFSYSFYDLGKTGSYRVSIPQTVSLTPMTAIGGGIGSTSQTFVI